MKMKWKIIIVLKTAVITLGFFFGPLLFSPISLAVILGLQTAPRETMPVSVYAFLWQTQLPLLLVSAVLALAAPAATIASLFYRKRLWCSVCFGLWMMSWLSWSVGLPARRDFSARREDIYRIAEKAKPVVSMLEKYRDDHGTYPSSLDSLIPDYLPSKPLPDALGCAEYQYILPTERTDARFRSYELKLKTPLNILNWDCFVYWPEQGYPDKMYGGPVERIGNWAYVHE